MSIDRDDKFEGHEESEYHFSDEDVHYEVDNETPKEEVTTASATEPKENFLKRVTGSKRMIISLAVFLVLVFVVYKMVGTSTTVPSTEIGPTVVARPTAMPATATQAPTTTPATTTQASTLPAPEQPQPVAAMPRLD